MPPKQAKRRKKDVTTSSSKKRGFTSTSGSGQCEVTATGEIPSPLSAHSDDRGETKTPLNHSAQSSVGLASLPAELLLEITSYLPQLPVPTPKNEDIPFPTTKSGLERVNFLRVLSQTCRTLRSFALPLAWERIEVCASNSKQRRSWGRELATELVKQLEIVTIRDPSLAKYVKTVNVAFTRYSSSAVLKEFVRCLALFPNLQAIQILDDSYLEWENALPHDAMYPTVRTLVFGRNSAAILRCCPNAKLIQCTGYGKRWLRDVYFHNSQVEELRNFEFNYSSYYGEMARYVKSLKQLRVINLNEQDDLGWREQDKLSINSIEPFQLLKDLHYLHCIRVFAFVGGDFRPPGKRHELPGLLADILQTTPPPDPGKHKCVISVFKNSTDPKRRHIVVSGQCTSAWDLLIGERPPGPIMKPHNCGLQYKVNVGAGSNLIYDRTGYGSYQNS